MKEARLKIDKVEGRSEARTQACLGIIFVGTWLEVGRGCMEYEVPPRWPLAAAHIPVSYVSPRSRGAKLKSRKKGMGTFGKYNTFLR
jgi:hypothetical protein